MPPFAKVFVAFALYALIHSALLTRWARAALEAAWGVRRFEGWFRGLFSVQATVLLGVFIGYTASLPDTFVFQADPGAAVVLWCLRATSLVFILWCVGRFGFARFLGFSQWLAWVRGEPVPGDGVETGELVVSGPYRWVRHPMYAAGFVLLWAEPRWPTNDLAFAVAASMYLWLGALHEERRLLNYYGDSYRSYAQRTPRFFPYSGRRRG